jgi:hypothetical protein
MELAALQGVQRLQGDISLLGANTGQVRQHLAVTRWDTIPACGTHAFLVAGKYDVSVFQMELRDALMRGLRLISHGLPLDDAKGLEQWSCHDHEAAERHDGEVEQEFFELLHAVTS